MLNDSINQRLNVFLKSQGLKLLWSRRTHDITYLEHFLFLSAFPLGIITAFIWLGYQMSFRLFEPRTEGSLMVSVLGMKISLKYHVTFYYSFISQWYRVPRITSWNHRYNVIQGIMILPVVSLVFILCHFKGSGAALTQQGKNTIDIQIIASVNICPDKGVSAFVDDVWLIMFNKGS